MNSIQYHKRYVKIRNKKTLRSEVKRTTKTLIITLATMIVILSIAFLSLTSKSAQKGYELAQQEIKNKELKDQEANIKSQLTEATSFSNLETEVFNENMEEAEKKDYIRLEDTYAN
ncbi:hypothetical protein KJ632_01750 [Patescibacteria group bacterium]|nr:hypothetical protein [Patescibacteria group bacterium]